MYFCKVSIKYNKFSNKLHQQVHFIQRCYCSCPLHSSKTNTPFSMWTISKWYYSFANLPLLRRSSVVCGRSFYDFHVTSCQKHIWRKPIPRSQYKIVKKLSNALNNSRQPIFCYLCRRAHALHAIVYRYRKRNHYWN